MVDEMIGQKVSIQGNEGEIVEVADKVKVKFDNGNFGFFDKLVIQNLVIDTRLKSANKDQVYMPKEAMEQDPFSKPAKKEEMDEEEKLKLR